MTLFSYVAGLGAWNWMILALILYGLEAIVPGVHFMWFATAAILVGGLVFATDITWPWQLVVFAVLSIATVFVVKQYARPDAHRSDLPDLNLRGAQYIGREFAVAEAIRGGRGKVQVGDTLWQAEGPDMPVGTRVRVSAAKDTVLVVERAAG